MSAPTVTPDARQLARAVARYHAGCLRVIGAQNVALRDVRTTKKAALCCDVGRLASFEEVLSEGRTVLRAPVPPRQDAPRSAIEDYERLLVIWERTRELASKAAVEAYAKEVVYGAPLLAGFLPKKAAAKPEPVLAPLLMQSVTLAVGDQGEIIVTSTDEPPRFNTAVWQEAVRADDLQQIVGLGIDAQGDLAAGFDPERVNTLLTAIASVFPAVTPDRPDGTLEPWAELTDAKERRDRPEMSLHNGGVLFLANRASPYLLHDLETIAEEPAAVLRRHRPLNVLLNPPATEARPELESRSLQEVVYPFPSNAAQRQVVDALDKNRIVVVQGPPGNGKSLMIANLVAHLVANGHSVLVSSHKNQALTVVRDKLESIGQRFLYASLVGDGAAAKRELQRQIADVKAFAGAANRKSLERQLAEIEERRTRSGDRYERLRADFIARAEPAQHEAARLFEAFRDLPTLPVGDQAPDKPARPAAASALRRLDELARAHATVWARLLGTGLAATDHHRVETATLQAFIASQRARLAAATDPRVGALVEAWHSIVDADPSQIDIGQAVIGQIRHALAHACPPAATLERTAGVSLADAPALLDDVEHGTAQLQKAFDTARGVSEHRSAIVAPLELRAQIRQQHALLASMVRRRGARKWLDTHAPGAAGLDSDTVNAWASFWDAWERLRTIAQGLAGGLRSELPAAYDPDAAQQAIAKTQRASQRARAIIAARETALRSRLSLPLRCALDAESVDALDGVIVIWMQALTAAQADRAGNELKLAAELRFLDGAPLRVDELLDAANYDAAADELTILEAVLVALPAIAERRRLLDGPLRTLTGAARAIEAAAGHDEPEPAFLDVAEHALEVHDQVRRFHAIADAPSTRALADELSALTEEVMQDARRYLGAKIQSRILEGFRKPSFLASLEAFRKAIGSSPKRYERFEELKHSPNFDIDVLTDVFPCWIMRPEDVCRVFPLRTDVFDVVIVDEASQCNPDQVLPLFARSSRALIVGDDKQLSNEDLRRSLSSNANISLLRQANLDQLDPAGLFDQTQNSLLELTSHRQQASVLLNEHFRCRPEIVAFSNHRYYGNTLTVIRDREDDQGLGPALILREVHAPPAAIYGKVNRAEAHALVGELQRRLQDERYAGMSFGVLSLFREQVEFLEQEIEREVPRALRERHRLICSTVDGFQGDERDVILYSWRYSDADHPAVFAFTNGGGGEQRTNVALTRARHQAIHFLSVPVDRFPASAANVSAYLRHAAEPEALLKAAERRAHREPTGPARQALSATLTDAGLRVSENYVACGVSVDLLVHDDANAKRVAVLVDADRAQYRPPDTPERVDQQAVLERSGWTVVRAPATEALPALAESVELITAALVRSQALRTVGGPDEQAHETIEIDEVEIPVADATFLDLEIAAEDRADYHWEVAGVEKRLAAGEAVFHSDFERDLYTMLARIEDLKVVPQWPTRGKSIDFVITDRKGRRLGVEADGAQHHETDTGVLIPEDLERQALLEEAGWSFCRVRHADFSRDPDGQIDRITQALAAREPNLDLAALVWTDAAVEDALSTPVEMAEPAVDVATEAATPTGAGALMGIPSEPAADPVNLTSAVPPDDVVAAPAPEPVSVEEQQVAASVDDSAITIAGSDTDAAAALPTPDEALLTPANVNAPSGGDARVAPPVARRSIEDVELAQITLQLAELIGARGPLSEDQLADAYAIYFDVAVPPTWHRTLKRFAWTAKGQRYIELVDEIWISGAAPAHPDERYGDWTFRKMVQRAAEMLVHDEDPFEDLLAEVYGGTRIPKLAMSLVGSAINQARRDQQLHL